jgi:two-component sensor histidine kinase
MDEAQMSKALDAIHEEAVKLLEHEMPHEVNNGLHLIISLARYKSDVRAPQKEPNDKDQA